MHDYRGNRRYFNIPSDLLSTSAEFLKNSRTTAYRALYAVFNVFLSCHTGMEDICLGTPVAPKNPACRGVENLIGHFVNTVVLRTNLSGNPTFREVIRRADATVDAAMAHSDLPLNKVVELLRSMRDPGCPLLMRSNFRALKQGFPALRLKGVSAGRADYVDTGTSKFDLALEIESASGKAFFEYRTALFREETIAQMEEDYIALLRGLLARPDIPLSHVPEVADIGGRVRARKRLSSSRG
jgi:non-ribosomal peptide synthetase component F